LHSRQIHHINHKGIIFQTSIIVSAKLIYPTSQQFHNLLGHGPLYPQKIKDRIP